MAALLEKIEYKYFPGPLFWLFLKTNSLRFLQNDFHLAGTMELIRNISKKIKKHNV